MQEFGPEAIKRVSVGKYPDEYGVLITVDKRDSRMSQLSDEMERQFEEKGIEVGVGISTWPHSAQRTTSPAGGQGSRGAGAPSLSPLFLCCRS